MFVSLIDRFIEADWNEQLHIEAQILSHTDAISELISAYETVSRRQKTAVIRLLAATRDERIEPMMVQLLYAEDIVIALYAMDALAKLNTPTAYQHLIDRLPASSGMLAMNIIIALGKNNYQPAIPFLIQLVQTTDSDTIRYTAIELLGKLDARDAKAVIACYLDHENHHVRERAHIALNRLNH